MKLEKGKKYKCTCFNGNECTVLDFLEHGLVRVLYRGSLYIASSYNLYE